MASFTDAEFGTVTIRRSKLAKSIRLSVAPNGTLRVSMPVYAPQFMAKRLINSSRDKIRELLGSEKTTAYTAGMQVGKSHTIEVRAGAKFSVTIHGQRIIVIAPGEDITSQKTQAEIRAVVIKALRKEAKNYLPRRLAFLAERHGYTYERVRFSHASSRWGSCSSSGTISLNIALMKLPFELIDYVLIHELSHTKEMNHSAAFWGLVQQSLPDYVLKRSQIKNETPTL